MYLESQCHFTINIITAILVVSNNFPQNITFIFDIGNDGNNMRMTLNYFNNTFSMYVNIIRIIRT